ncbi:hypothetical protein EJ02DRAFT_514037 [Clathrospora elynae]|uniref:Uncharacterized protein n=1 Tax=Clathrospora elynae TaxID=706981 RepID=A0A6A5SHU1_9PLEO|nr:hypothetical protein EJ02DRAFT_514037 [Clathrospora elynae]
MYGRDNFVSHFANANGSMNDRRGPIRLFLLEEPGSANVLCFVRPSGTCRICTCASEMRNGEKELTQTMTGTTLAYRFAIISSRRFFSAAARFLSLLSCSVVSKKVFPDTSTSSSFLDPTAAELSRPTISWQPFLRFGSPERSSKRFKSAVVKRQ